MVAREDRPSAPDPFRLVLPANAPPSQRAALVAARPLLEWTLALPTYRALYRQAQGSSRKPFRARALEVLEIDVDLVSTDPSSVPSSGPLLVVANHPHGMLDGLALAEVVGRRRPDVRVMTNDLLAPVPELSELCLFVDAFDAPVSATRSQRGLRQALRWLEDGHALIVFPSGTVAHGEWRSSATPVDADWRHTVGRLALRTGATILPAFIEGRNSRRFYLAGEVHTSLRTLLLARELLGQRGRRVRVRLGPPLSLGHQRTRDGAAATAIMRTAVDRLRQPTPCEIEPAALAVSAADGATRVAAEVERLGIDQHLVRSHEFDVYCASSALIPNVLQEIGRLREITFRSVGEGTGQQIDLDRFDRHYLQLFVWNRATSEVVGAYRLGLVDRILATQGIGGLYTSTLFRYDHRLLARLGPAIELGRSFVRADYQRSSNALLLLWKGIAAFVARSGRYRVLFGPVSISRRYRDTSQQLLREFLAQNHCHRELAVLVEAVTPPPALPHPSRVLPAPDLRALDKLVAGEEPDGKGIPVLLRQYLRLNAKLLGFNVDPAFGDALDALMMVDLTDVDRAVLNRYFGADQAARLVSQASTVSRRTAA